VWNESFAISLPNSTDFQETDEVLHLDVWNFLPDEKLREKLKRINEVKVTIKRPRPNLIKRLDAHLGA